MPFELTIVTPYGEAYRGPAESVVLPGTEGDFGVLPNHERFLTPLRVGAVEIGTGSEKIYAAIADGFAEVSGEHVAVLVDSCELAGDIDTARAEMARDRAERGLEALGRDEGEERLAEFHTTLERARNRLEVASRR
jgi:F-type H+-transporting ATPase subunit epsilon